MPPKINPCIPNLRPGLNSVELCSCRYDYSGAGKTISNCEISSPVKRISVKFGVCEFRY